MKRCSDRELVLNTYISFKSDAMFFHVQSITNTDDYTLLVIS